jgi:hypothetical protein
MRTRSKLALIGLGATMLMALALSTASARNLSISNQNIRATFNNLEFIAGEFTPVTCRVTLEGSLHSRTIPKTPELLLGYITRVITGQCSEPVTVLTATLPWHVRYVGFSGRLPDITLLLIRLRRPSFNVEGGFGFRCLSEADLNGRFIRNTTTGQLTPNLPRQSFPVRGGGGFGCPVSTGEMQSVGDARLFLLGGTTLIFLTLI